MTSNNTDLQDYAYYFVSAPWLSVKLLRLLQNYSTPGIYLNFKLTSKFLITFNFGNL